MKRILVLLSAVVLHDPLKWIREGTILSALLIGTLASFLRKKLSEPIAKLAYGGDK